MPKRFKLALAVEGVDLHDEDQVEDLMAQLPDVHWKKIAGQVQAVALLDCAKQDIAAEIRQIATAVAATSRDAKVTDVVEDFVSISDIAKRSGFTRQYARMLVTGERGPGGFPRPIGSVGKMQIWDWAPVSAWLQVNYELGDPYRLLTRDELASLRRAIATAHPERRHRGPHEETHQVGIRSVGKIITLQRHRHTHRPHLGRAFQKASAGGDSLPLDVEEVHRRLAVVAS